MLDIRAFRDEPDAVRDGLRRRGEDPDVVDRIRELDAAWRGDLASVEALRAERNAGSKAVAAAKEPEERAERIAAMRALGERIAALEERVAAAEAELSGVLKAIPNMPAPETPDGRSDEDNVVLRTCGSPDVLDFPAQPHWDLGPAQGLIDFDRGVRLAGSRFYVLMGRAARLQRALIDWLLELQVARGYTEVYPPFVVREECMWNAGQLPKFADNLYHDAEDDLWLVPTAEVPLTNLHAGEILAADQLPRKYTAYTPCFRREKMSAGRDVRGIKRGHQFDKVELYRFTRPENSAAALDEMVADAEAALAGLGLVYRVVAVCAGDLGFASRITYDLEAWAAGCGEWLEVSSVSNVGDFQARRAGIRYRPEAGAGAEPLHTLNGSALGIPRTMIALLENNQTADGRIRVPEALRDRVGADFLG